MTPHTWPDALVWIVLVPGAVFIFALGLAHVYDLVSDEIRELIRKRRGGRRAR